MMLSVAEIEQRLRDRTESLVRELLPNVSREGHYLKIGSVNGEPGGSLVIHLSGEKQGRWRDYAADKHGDMLDLIGAVYGLAGKGEAVAWAKDWLGIVDQWSPVGSVKPNEVELARRAEEARARQAAQQESAQQEREAKMRGARALFLHEKAVPIAGTPAEAYLVGRGLSSAPIGEWPGSLRFHPEVYHGPSRVKMPAMLAMAVTAEGKHVATHRTFIERVGGAWRKIEGNAKMVLGPMWGGFVPVAKGASGKSMRHMLPDEPVYMAEGIEKCIAIRMKQPAARIICSINLGNMGAIILPEAARRIVMVCDRDDGEQQLQVLERAMARQQARGIHVQQVMPPAPYKDIDEWMLAVAPLPAQMGAAA
jgi:Toprim domain